MNHHDKILELRKAQIREVELMGELRAFLKLNIARNRMYEDGQLVEVFDKNDESLGQGIIDCAFCRAYLESNKIKRYSESPQKWEEEINFILYRVNVVKKDGTKGSYKLATCSEIKTKYNNYFKPII